MDVMDIDIFLGTYMVLYNFQLNFMCNKNG